MKTLNLTNADNSDIKYQISRFPDGQQQVVISEFRLGRLKTISEYSIIIKARLNNFKDLELIICATKSLRNLGVKEIHLYTPYFLGSRSDRQFEEGSNNYLKDVICPIINSLNFDSVTVLDPHSDVLEACLNNFKKIDNFKLVQYAIHRMPFEYDTISKHKILISPDAGANKKIFKIAEQIGYKGEILTCSKSRDVDGKLTKTIVPIVDNRGDFLYHLENKDFIIIDDICDGGATFINIAKPIYDYVKHLGLNNKIYLIVTHGIFSKGFEELSQYFDGIYCTNSYSSIEIKGIPCVQRDKFGNNGEFIKQLNVF